MPYLQKILDDPVSLIFGFIVVVLAVKECMEIWKYFKSRGKEMYDTDAELKKMCERISGVEKKQDEQVETNLAIQHTLVNINTSLANLEKERKADTVAHGRAMLYDLYNQLKDKETLTMGEYEVIQDVFNRYEKSGGNGTFKKISKILLSKPIEK